MDKDILTLDGIEEVIRKSKIFDTFTKDSIILQEGPLYDCADDEFISKVGGYPYWPLSRINEYPRINGKPLCLICQLAFDEEDYDGLEGFPDKGILQFYLDDYEGSKVVYWENTDEDPALPDEFPKIDYETIPRLSPENCCSLEFWKHKVSTLHYHDMNSIEKSMLTSVIQNELGNTDFSDETIAKIIESVLLNYDNKLAGDRWGTKLGGYPGYTQRADDEFAGMIQLLQLDTDPSLQMNWGDDGIAHFFITPKDLKNRNFDNVKFTWDCY